jgi:hypothetical protein
MQMRGSAIDIGLWVAALGLVLATGCSNGDAGGLENSDGTSGPASGSTSNHEAASTAGLDESADEAEGTTGLGPSSDTDSDGGLECAVDCGEGTCEVDEEGAHSCACNEGFAPYGLRCLPCTPIAGIYDVDIPLVTVSATFLLGDDPFPASIYHRGQIVLVDPATGDEVPLGHTHDGTGEVAVLPGSYEVHYAWKAGSNVPVNRGARIDTVVIPADQDTFDLVVRVPIVEISGALTFNDAAPPTSQYETGDIVLVEPATGDEAPLGETRDGEYRVNVIPGTYQVHYRRRVAENIAPINADARFAALVVDDTSDPQTHAIDVPITTLSGAFTLDSETPPASIYENGRIVLRDTETDDLVMLGQTREGSYAAPVVAGQYQTIYERVQGGQVVPINRAALLDELELEAGARALDIDVATAVVTGVITVGDQPPPADPGDDGIVLLRNPQTGDEALLGNTAVGSYSQRVVRGTYDVYYRQETSSGGVPVNTNALLVPEVEVLGGANVDIDVPIVTVSASVTVGGQAPPSSVYDDGVLYLRNAETGDSVLLGNTRLAALQRPVVPGTYDVFYVVEAAGPTMPINARSHLTTVEVGPATQLEVDIPVTVLQGAITVGGGPVPPSIYNRASLLLHDVDTADVVYLGSTDAGSFARTLTAGTYVLVYQALATTGLLPANTNAGLACLELQGP